MSQIFDLLVTDFHAKKTRVLVVIDTSDAGLRRVCCNSILFRIKSLHMSRKSNNLRPFPLFFDKPMTRDEAVQWLEAQSEAVRRVTFVAEDGRLMQRPVIEDGAFVDPAAVLVGGMIIGPRCYVGPHAVIRLDEKTGPEPLIIGEASNVQDSAVIHADTTRIGSRVIIAHQAIVHGAVVEDEVAIYIQAVADGNGTVLGRGCFLHQGSYVGKGIQVPAGRYIEPGRKILAQADADRLPPVPEALITLREHVIEHNLGHAKRHLAI